MNVKKHPMENYRKFLLNRSTANTAIVEFIENLNAAEDEVANYTFHKIMVHSWCHENDTLFDTLSEYFSAWFVPIDVNRQRSITSFYTSSLNLILRLTRLDFMFPFERNMFNIDVLFNDKTSVELFGNNISVEDIISGVVSGRFDEKQILDLSDLANDKDFKEYNISFYKISLLANFRILMLRMGKNAKTLNLAYNGLVQPPLDIMNFFIKGELTEINLSYNKIASIADLVRVTSKIEKLWVEGNPLCEDMEPAVYVKQITVKFPRLTELDGVKLNEFGLGFPFCRNYMINPTKHLKMVVEKFLTVYFSHYDNFPRRKHIDGFYDDNCCLSVTTGFTPAEKMSISSLFYATMNRNLINYNKQKANIKDRLYASKNVVLTLFSQMPRTFHDPTSFSVDLLRHDKKCMILIVDGVFKDIDTQGPNIFRFRRTFVFNVYKNQMTTSYKIRHELFYVACPTHQQLDNCFKLPVRDLNTLELIHPEPEETETLTKIFCQLTHLKNDESARRLTHTKWDLKRALIEFMSDLTSKKVDQDVFMEEDPFSDSSSIIDDEMVD